MHVCMCVSVSMLFVYRKSERVATLYSAAAGVRDMFEFIQLINLMPLCSRLAHIYIGTYMCTWSLSACQPTNMYACGREQICIHREYTYARGAHTSTSTL